MCFRFCFCSVRIFCFFFSSRRRHTRWPRDWSSDVCSSDLLSRARRLVRSAMVADAADEADWQETHERFDAADDALAVLRACTGAQREQLAELLSATGGGGLIERPRIALTDALSG